MKRKRIIVSIIATAIVLAVAGVVLVLASQGQRATYTVIDVGGSLCAMDMPSSQCGPVEVKLKSTHGTERASSLKGFDNRRDGAKREGLSKKLQAAQEANRPVEVTIRNGYIVAVQ